MNQKIKYIGLFAILPLLTVALSPDYIIDADALKRKSGDLPGTEVDAQKAEGSTGAQSPKSYGSATDDIVCGAILCSTPEGSEDPVNVGRAS